MLPTAPVGVKVDNGRFQRVSLTNANGKVVAGKFNSDRTAFTVIEPLGYESTYTWAGAVVGQDGKAQPVEGNSPPSPRRNRSTVSSSSPTARSSGWPHRSSCNSTPPSTTSIARPSKRLSRSPPRRRSRAAGPGCPTKPGAHVCTGAPASTTRPEPRSASRRRCTAVSFGDGAYGATDSTLDFEIGRRQVVKAEASSHRIQVLDGSGAVIMDFPCSYGEGDLDRNVTRSGVHVVTEKYEDFWMTNPAAGYSNVHERFAVRISNNGEFIHCNPNSIGSQGNTNVTNGCINLNLENSQQYFNSAMYGDPVEVTGTRIELSYADGDLWDWAVDWNEWKSMSALSSEDSPSNLPASAPATPTDAPTLSGTPTTTTPPKPAPGG